MRCSDPGGAHPDVTSCALSRPSEILHLHKRDQAVSGCQTPTHTLNKPKPSRRRFRDSLPPNTQRASAIECDQPLILAPRPVDLIVMEEVDCEAEPSKRR